MDTKTKFRYTERLVTVKKQYTDFGSEIQFKLKSTGSIDGYVLGIKTIIIFQKKLWYYFYKTYCAELNY